MNEGNCVALVEPLLAHGRAARIITPPGVKPSDAREGRVAAVFDLDGTVTSNDTYVAFLLSSAARRPWRLPWLATLPWAYGVHRLGLRDNAWLKATALWATAAGAEGEWTGRVAERLVRRSILPRVRPRAERRIESHRRQGHRLVLATASFDIYVDRLARQLGFDDWVCTHADRDDRGRLSGRIRGRNCHGPEKLTRLRTLFATRGEWWIIGYSDHVSDLPLLEWSDEPIAVNPERRLRRAARERGWPIEDWRSETTEIAR